MTSKREAIERLDKRADRFDTIVARSLRRSIRAGTRGLGNVVTAAITPEPVPDPEDPGAADFVSLDDLAAIEQAWQVELREVLTPQIMRIVEAGAEDAINDIADLAHLSIKDLVRLSPVLVDGRHPAAELHVMEAQNRLRGIGNDLWLKTRMQLVDGMSQGESIPKLTKRVREELAVSTTRARTIARTEVISASNAGAFAQARLLDASIRPVSKTWLATNDSRTRLTHRSADGQTVAMDDPFNVGVANMEFPGDPTGPAQEVINCRCTLTRNLPELAAVPAA